MAHNDSTGAKKIDNKKIQDVCKTYFLWKELNKHLKDGGGRALNMPESLSEPIACYTLGLLWNDKDTPGDATNPRDNSHVEIKATSNFDKDLTQFSPTAKFADLIFLRFKQDEDLVYVYDLNMDSEELGKYPANKKQTIEEQREQGRRPHIQLLELFINNQNRQPDYVFDLKSGEIKKN